MSKEKESIQEWIKKWKKRQKRTLDKFAKNQGYSNYKCYESMELEK